MSNVLTFPDQKAPQTTNQPAPSRAEQDRVQILEAIRLLDEAELQLTLFDALFEHDDGNPRVAVRNLHRACVAIERLLKAAASTLFDTFDEDRRLYRQNIKVYSSFDLVRLASAAIAKGELLDGDGLTVSPVREAMRVAREKVTSALPTLRRRERAERAA